ncbi:hypothetical protein RYX56_03455 [Alkalihalophilus lindianensis]|uniref:DUF4367 domain-containing protein n=1 Tax=Alkalihalophilus lindianensis TaxID=1630542 RepID=A0ABU3X698_9BACI|nr:hypothetical protein [Alkalihalophilus lindianensis]MDV2683426.1 hypothetical protein [Alkalihalophilus lindianensis]
MNDNQFDQQMKKLKKQYEQMPTKSSTDHIMSAVLKEKKPRRTTLFRNWRVAASLTAAVGIGAILSMGGFFQGGTDQFSTIEEERAQEQNDEEVAIFQSDIEGENVINESEEEETDSNEPSDASSIELENPVELGETREETFLMEGQEDVNEVIEFTDREIGFRSVVQSGFDIEGEYRENDYSLQLSADYGDGMIEPPFYTMRKYHNGSAEEVADGLYSELEEDGFVRYEESSLTITGRQSAFEVTDERLYMRGDESVQLAVILNDDTVYSIKIHTTTEYTEGLQIRVGQVLEHFQWIN